METIKRVFVILLIIVAVCIGVPLIVGIIVLILPFGTVIYIVGELSHTIIELRKNKLQYKLKLATDKNILKAEYYKQQLENRLY